MKITKQHLQQIIKENLESLLDAQQPVSGHPQSPGHSEPLTKAYHGRDQVTVYPAEGVPTLKAAKFFKQALQARKINAKIVGYGTENLTNNDKSFNVLYNSNDNRLFLDAVNDAVKNNIISGTDITEGKKGDPRQLDLFTKPTKPAETSSSKPPETSNSESPRPTKKDNALERHKAHRARYGDIDESASLTEQSAPLSPNAQNVLDLFNGLIPQDKVAIIAQLRNGPPPETSGHPKRGPKEDLASYMRRVNDWNLKQQQTIKTPPASKGVASPTVASANNKTVRELEEEIMQEFLNKVRGK